jgi:hypothetical protein
MVLQNPRKETLSEEKARNPENHRLAPIDPLLEKLDSID